MSGIRPLEREDLSQAVRLFEVVMRDGAERPLPPLAGFFERTLFDNPRADPDLPSLVYEDDRGEIVGMICSNPRRMVFDSHPIRMACCAYLLVLPGARRHAVGALLLRAYISGPQDLTITDGATETVRRMWEGLGGLTAHLGCLSFIKPFRPWQLAGDHLLTRRSFDRLQSGLRPALSALDRLSARLAATTLVPPKPDGTVEPLDPAMMLDHMPGVTASLRLRPDYDQEYLEWLFGELEDVARWGPVQPRLVRRGPPWAELVRKNGRVLGWYVCNLRRGGFCRVLQFAATPATASTVFDQLAHRSREMGAAGLYGRIEPLLVGPLDDHRCLIRVGPGRLLLHSRNEEILSAILSGQALLTRLDGEWW